MTKVSFYYGTRDRSQAALAWLADAWRRRERVTVFQPDGDARARFSRLLWSAPATGFLPHCESRDKVAPQTAIVLTGDLAQAEGEQSLLNLSDQTPPGFGRYEHLIEIISTDDVVRTAGRERFRQYRDKGYDIASFDLGALVA